MANSEPMADERLAEIMSLTADVGFGRILPRFDEETAWLAILDLRREVERLRASETEHERTITALEARYEQQGNYHHQLVRRLTDAMEIVHALADGEVYHDSKGGMLMVASPNALLSKARALLERE